MDAELQRLVEERLAADGRDDESWAMLVLAACEGGESLDGVLGGAPLEPRRRRRGARGGGAGSGAADGTAAEATEPLGAYLRSISVEGFRGIGPEATLELVPGPGLTLVLGRNGSGKSSFAEGLEILLTGENSRWVARSKVWGEDWRNLHHPTPTRVSADLAVEGEKGSTSVSRTWAEGVSIDQGATVVRLPTRGRTDLAALGWHQALTMYRPFLPYNELGSLFDEGPTKLHDRLSRILGLGELEEAAERLRRARLDREAVRSDAKKAVPRLLARLEGADDERAVRVRTALSKRTWDLDAVASVLEAPVDTAERADVLGVLRALASLPAPAPDDLLEAAEALTRAADGLDELQGTTAADAAELAGILEEALAYHRAHGEGDCPVCGRRNALSPAWRERTEARLSRLRDLAHAWEQAQTVAQGAERRALGKLVGPPPVLDLADRAGLDARPLRRAWLAFVSPPDGLDLRGLAAHLVERVGPVAAEATALRDGARAELDRREDLWRPVAIELAAWLKVARTAAEAEGAVKDLKAAEDWLKGTSGEIRQQRFEPIAAAVVENWSELRQRSSVELARVALEGTGTARKVRLDVIIDGVEGAALGVMSQGELHAIALGMFLPRATLPASPFRFVVIDDPVQSMDPGRVDGLAQVLARTARSRQVVVFTHDDRLAEATRRLGIDARILEVTRRERSAVTVRPSSDPMSRNLDDARALASARELPPEVAAQVVPGFCRAAIEAVCIEVVRRRRIGRGEPHAEVERLLEDQNLTPLLALALFDTAAKGGEVAAALGARWGTRAADAWGAANRGAHLGHRGALDELVADTQYLCDRVREIRLS